MITASLDHPETRSLQSGGTQCGIGDTNDFGHVLHELGACSWSGTATPLQARVKSPVPTRLAGFEREGVNWFESVYPQDSERVIETIVKAVRGETIAPFEYRMVTDKADIVWVRHWWAKKHRSMAACRDGQIDGFVQVIDERKELEAECIRTSERERHQIGQELHDDVCQILAGLACMLELFGRQVKVTSPGLIPTVKELVAQVNGGMQRARSLAHGLVPFRLLNLGLPAALAEFAAQTAASRGLSIRTDFSVNNPVHSPDQILHLYRIAQEAIGNAIHHGHATEISLSLRHGARRSTLAIRDNGCGILATALHPQGVGLQIMQHRAFEIGADFSISSPSTGGILVMVNYKCVSTRLHTSKKKT